MAARNIDVVQGETFIAHVKWFRKGDSGSEPVEQDVSGWEFEFIVNDGAGNRLTGATAKYDDETESIEAMISREITSKMNTAHSYSLRGWNPDSETEDKVFAYGSLTIRGKA